MEGDEDTESEKPTQLDLFYGQEESEDATMEDTEDTTSGDEKNQ